MADISLRKEHNYTSSLYQYLAAYPEEKLFHKVHSPALLHPADILSEHTNDVVDTIERLQTALDSDDVPARETKDLFQSLDTFFDTCFEIIKAFINPAHLQSTEHDNYKWLSENKIHQGKDFLSSVSSHKDFVSKINNKLKHNTAQILKINLTDNLTQTLIKGFYVGTVIKDDHIGPDPEIHKHWNNKRTGFSYNYIIKRLIGHIFLYEYQLQKILEGKFGKVPYTNAVSEYSHKKLFEIGKEVDEHFFPNEYIMPNARFSETKNSLLIEFPRTYEQNKKYDYTITTEPKINRRTNTATGYIPYFGNKIE